MDYSLLLAFFRKKEFDDHINTDEKDEKDIENELMNVNFGNA